MAAYAAHTTNTKYSSPNRSQQNKSHIWENGGLVREKEVAGERWAKNRKGSGQKERQS